MLATTPLILLTTSPAAAKLPTAPSKASHRHSTPRDRIVRRPTSPPFLGEICHGSEQSLAETRYDLPRRSHTLSAAPRRHAGAMDARKRPGHVKTGQASLQFRRPQMAKGDGAVCNQDQVRGKRWR